MRHLYDVQVNNLLRNEYPILEFIPVVHRTGPIITTDMLFIVINLSNENNHLEEGEILGFLEPSNLDICDITIQRLSFKTRVKAQTLHLTQVITMYLKVKMIQMRRNSLLLLHHKVDL